MKTILQLLLFLLAGCSLGKQGVYIDEMQSKPGIRLENNILIVKTTNSIKNSALLIYKIKIAVNQNKKEIFLSAYQAAGKEFHDEFKIDLEDYNVLNPDRYTFFWLDPDQKKTKLDTTT